MQFVKVLLLTLMAPTVAVPLTIPSIATYARLKPTEELNVLPVAVMDPIVPVKPVVVLSKSNTIAREALTLVFENWLLINDIGSTVTCVLAVGGIIEAKTPLTTVTAKMLLLTEKPPATIYAAIAEFLKVKPEKEKPLAETFRATP